MLVKIVIHTNIEGTYVCTYGVCMYANVTLMLCMY